MEFGREAELLVFQVKEGIACGADLVVVGMDEAGGRGVLGHDHLGLEGEIRLVVLHQVGGVHRDHEAGPGVAIQGRVFGVGAFVGMQAGEDAEVAAGAEAEDADAVGLETPLGGVMTDQAHGALGVLQRGGFGMLVVAPWHAVLENDAGDAQSVEVIGDLGAFVFDGQDAVAAAGADQNGGAVGLLGLVNRDGGIADVAGAGDLVLALHGLLRIDLEAGLLSGAGGPKFQRDRLGRMDGGSQGKGEEAGQGTHVG